MRSSGPKVGSQAWFDLNQGFLLWLANTRAGRDMLCIRRDVPQNHSIVRLRPNGFDSVERGPRETFVHALWGLRQAARRGEPVEIRADFRCRPKIANRLAHSWVRNVPAWNRYLVDTWDRLGSPFRMRPAFADSPLTAYPDPGPDEISSCDGIVYEQNRNEIWATLVARAGFAASDNSATAIVILAEASATSNQWEQLDRGIFLFLTSSIGSGQSITDTTLSIVSAGKGNDLPLTVNANVYSSLPASNTQIVAGDYDSLGTTPLCDTPIAYASWTGTVSWAFNAAGLLAVAPTDVTKLGLRDANFDVPVTPPTWASLGYSYLIATMAETTGTASDPKLVVTYTAGWPYVGSLSQMGIGI